MELDYFGYAEANIVSILILAILLFNDKLHSTKQEKQLWFNRTVIAHILYFSNDIIWAAVLSGQIRRTTFLVVLCNFLNYVLLSLLSYEWFMYMAASEQMQFRTVRKKRILWLLPMIIFTAVIVISYVAAPSFWVNEEGMLNDLYYPLMVAAPTLYMLSAFVISMVNARKANTRDKKRQYLLIGIYPIAVLISGLIQTFMLNAPLFCFGCALMLVFFYIQNLQALISIDPLTRLNNRRQIDRYIEQVRYKENTAIFAMMIDVDRFKHINDTFGHAEGDRALVLVAEALKKTAGRIKSPVFIGRYGGDEFALFIQRTEERDTPERIAELIWDALHETQAKNALPYELNISIGYDLLNAKDDSLGACLARADQKLYEYKHAGRQASHRG